jgi:hypothetical protein
MRLGRETAVLVADRQVPGMQAEQAMAAEQAAEQATAAEQALIAEARARARRRRQKIALAVTAAAAALSAAGVLITLTVPGKPHKIDAIAPARPAIRTGSVVGHLDACAALPDLPGRPPRPPRITPGTVTAVRGTVSWKPIGPGTWREILPNGPVVARAHISDNYHQVFRFALPPGTYVLIGRYDGVSYPPAVTATTITQVSVIAGKTLHADLPDDCK